MGSDLGGGSKPRVMDEPEEGEQNLNSVGYVAENHHWPCRLKKKQAEELASVKGWVCCGLHKWSSNESDAIPTGAKVFPRVYFRVQ